MTSNQFRYQVVEYVSSPRYGTILLAFPIGINIITAVFVVFWIALLLFLVLFSYTKKEQVHGTLLPDKGLIKVLSLHSGIIAEVRVKEGQQVVTGDVMFILKDERFGATNENSSKTVSELLLSRLESLSEEQHTLKKQVKTREIGVNFGLNNLLVELNRLEELISYQKKRILLAAHQVTRYEHLYNSKFISIASLQNKQGELIDQQVKLVDLQRSRAGLLQEQRNLKLKLQEVNIQYSIEKLALQRDTARIEQEFSENEANRVFLIRAAQSGTVSAITASQGQAVTSSQSLAVLLPKDSVLEAELYVPSRAIGFVVPSMPVLLRYHAYPYQKFGQFNGTVLEVTKSTLPPVSFEPPVDRFTGRIRSEPIFRVRVKLDRQNVTSYGADQPLKAGMTLDASILREKRKLYEWVLDPVLSIGGHL